jgi:hypothetical protein
MSYARLSSKDYGRDWNLWRNNDAPISIETIQCILLQEIRDELKRLNALLHCRNFTAIPSKLERIARNTKRPTRRR